GRAARLHRARARVRARRLLAGDGRPARRPAASEAADRAGRGRAARRAVHPGARHRLRRAGAGGPHPLRRFPVPALRHLPRADRPRFAGHDGGLRRRRSDHAGRARLPRGRRARTAGHRGLRAPGAVATRHAAARRHHPGAAHPGGMDPRPAAQRQGFRL
ncbi:MAG: hypothetical protein AVDCRST_MAG44-569, partial [uncultured Sphingomonas sp.]